ncbi:MAG: hypothetical protein R3321_10180, partial [Nitrososphaeraceae archaeon]|nr:hypothetical protein [Nitrososphaeraceae archaeon]
FVCNSCSSIFGDYTHNGYHYGTKLKIEKDGTFELYRFLSGYDKKLYGSWSFNNDSLILSFENPDVIFTENIYSNVYEGNLGSSDSIYFNIHVTNEDSPILVGLLLNENPEEPYYFIDNNDTIAYLNDGFENIVVSSFIGGEVHINPKKETSNFFRVEIESLGIIENSVLINPDTLYLKKGRKLILADYPYIFLKKDIF